jgi:hypothetical protein
MTQVSCQLAQPAIPPERSRSAASAQVDISAEVIRASPLGFFLSTLASVQGLRSAVAAWNSGLPAVGSA